MVVPRVELSGGSRNFVPLGILLGKVAVEFAEDLRLERRLHRGADFLQRRPEITQVDVPAFVVLAQWFLGQVDVDPPGKGKSHHERRRHEEVGLHILVHAGLEIAVARKYGGGDEIVARDGLFDCLRKRAGIADACGATVADDLESELVEVGLKSGGMQVVLHDPGTGSQRGLHGGRNMEPPLDRLFGKEPGAEHDTRIAGVGATGDRRDDHTAMIEGGGSVAGAAPHIIRSGPVLFHFLNLLFFVGRHVEARMIHFDLRRLSARGRRLVVSTLGHRLFEKGCEGGFEVGQVDAVLRTLRPGHARLHRGEVELEVGAVVDVALLRHAEHLLRLEVGLEGGALLTGATGAAEVVHRLGIDREIAHGGPVFRRHVGDGRAVGERKRSRPLPVELDKFSDHLRLAEQLGDMQGEVRRGDAFAQAAGEIDPHHFGGEEIDGLAKHAGFRLDAAHAPADHAETVDHGGVRIGADQRVGVIKFAPVDRLREHSLGEVFEIHLVDDADAGRDDAECFEGLLPPFEKLVTLTVALELHLEVETQRVGTAEEVDLHGVVDDQIDRNEGLDHGGILARRGDRIAHGGQVDQEGHTGEILQHDAGDHERNLLGGRLLRLPRGKDSHILLADFAAVAIAEHGFQDDANAHRQPRDRTEPGGLETG